MSQTVEAVQCGPLPSPSWARILRARRRDRALASALQPTASPRARRDSRGKHGFPRAKAERAGFEPATHLSARTRFPVALLRPLGHLSVLRGGEGGIRTLDGGIHPHNALAGRRLQPLGHFSAGPRRIAGAPEARKPGIRPSGDLSRRTTVRARTSRWSRRDLGRFGRNRGVWTRKRSLFRPSSAASSAGNRGSSRASVGACTRSSARSPSTGCTAPRAPRLSSATS